MNQDRSTAHDGLLKAQCLPRPMLTCSRVPESIGELTGPLVMHVIWPLVVRLISEKPSPRRGLVNEAVCDVW
jgi:hypothetical protein